MYTHLGKFWQAPIKEVAAFSAVNVHINRRLFVNRVYIIET
jgi:hypothetical protein